MNWFYVDKGQQCGPISDSQLDELVGAGKIREDTLIWREGMAAWQPLTAARTPKPPQITGSQPNVPCAECGRLFPPSEVILLNNVWVCGGCKPLSLQRMQEGMLSADATVNLWRVRNLLVARHQTSFPDRCVRCNAPTNGYRHKVVFSSWFFKKAVLHLGLCEKHRARNEWSNVPIRISLLGGVVLTPIGLGIDSGFLAFIGLLVFLGGLVFGTILGIGISPVKIENDHVWLKGVNKDFLAQLPEWNRR